MPFTEHAIHAKAQPDNFTIRLHMDITGITPYRFLNDLIHQLNDGYMLHLLQRIRRRTTGLMPYALHRLADQQCEHITFSDWHKITRFFKLVDYPNAGKCFCFFFHSIFFF